MLDDVDLDLPWGCTAWIGGANGAGKTTLLRIVAGIVDPDQGKVSVAGHDVQEDPRASRSQLSFLPAASTGLYARLSVRHHLDLWARLTWMPFERRAGAIEEVVESFALQELLAARADRMSMGQRQRVRLAMTFLPAAPLVLLDEPSTSLDVAGIELLARAIEATKARGGTVVWCSPGPDTGPVAVDRHYEIRAGRLEESPAPTPAL